MHDLGPSACMILTIKGCSQSVDIIISPFWGCVDVRLLSFAQIAEISISLTREAKGATGINAKLTICATCEVNTSTLVAE